MSEMIETEKKDECPECQMTRLMGDKMVAMTLAHGACAAVGEQAKREDCMDWAMKLDADQIKEVKEILKPLYERLGIVELDNFIQRQNRLTRLMIIEAVGDKLEQRSKGINVDLSEDEEKLFRKYTQEQMAEGI